MRRSTRCPAWTRPGPSLLAALLSLSSCSSPPPHLYLLNSLATPPSAGADEKSGGNTASTGSSRPGSGAITAQALTLGVATTVPAYVDRPQIMVRNGANELVAMDDARWAEDLSVNTARTLAEDLAGLLPAADVIMSPDRSARAVDYAVHVDFGKFDIDSQGNTTIAGRWSIAESSGRERASRRFFRTERAERNSFDAIAAAMSRNLLGVSSDIAAALATLPPPSRAHG